MNPKRRKLLQTDKSCFRKTEGEPKEKKIEGRGGGAGGGAGGGGRGGAGVVAGGGAGGAVRAGGRGVVARAARTVVEATVGVTAAAKR